MPVLQSPPDSPPVSDSILYLPRLSYVEAARALGVNRISIYRWSVAGRLPSYLIGHRRYFLLRDLEAFMAAGKSRTPEGRAS